MVPSSHIQCKLLTPPPKEAVVGLTVPYMAYKGHYALIDSICGLTTPYNAFHSLIELGRGLTTATYGPGAPLFFLWRPASASLWLFWGILARTGRGDSLPALGGL
jgi:hypothetical protein